MRRRIFWSLAAATAALALAAGLGTYGFFSSTTSNPGNLFTSGHLELANSRPGSLILSATNMQPGDSISRDVVLTLAPASTLDLNYRVDRTITVDSGGAGGLCDALNIVVTRTDAGQAPDDGAAIPAGTVVSAGGDTLRSFASASVALGSLNNSGNNGDTYTFAVTFTDTGAPQALQDQTCEVTYTWTAVQQGTNEDITVSGP